MHRNLQHFQNKKVTMGNFWMLAAPLLKVCWFIVMFLFRVNIEEVIIQSLSSLLLEIWVVFVCFPVLKIAEYVTSCSIWFQISYQCPAYVDTYVALSVKPKLGASAKPCALALGLVADNWTTNESIHHCSALALMQRLACAERFGHALQFTLFFAT